MNLAECESVLTDLEQSPRHVQLRHAELESMIAWCMDEIYRLAKVGKDEDRKMRLVALEHRARLLLKRWKMLNVN